MLKDFTSTDRKEVLKRLLSNESVLETLHEMLFPSQQGSEYSPADEVRSMEPVLHGTRHPLFPLPSDACDCTWCGSQF